MFFGYFGGKIKNKGTAPDTVTGKRTPPKGGGSGIRSGYGLDFFYDFPQTTQRTLS